MIKMKKIWSHFKTITEHKLLVMKYCFKVGLYKQGLLHDLSKYSPEEFWTGVYYYQGNRSPNAAEREVHGFSKAWLHHKGRNKHHFEYWIDFSIKKDDGLVGHKMPLNYVIEMVMDRIAASRIYKGKDYTDRSALEYYQREKNFIVINPETRKLLERLLSMLAEKGERKTFAYMRKLLKRGSY
ncbi:MAG: catalase [Hungatella sp.]|nr:catalase [Hungatella sp.]